jgi:hypothetical protein
LHSIFAGKEKLHEGKSLNKNKDYMEAFNQWFTEHNLGRFFIDGYFCLDNIELLEKELQCSVNLYTFEGEAPELFYRSSYRYDGDIFNLVIIPMKYFFDGNIRPTPKLSDEETPPLIFPSMDLGKDFVSAESIKNMVTRRNGHCALLNTNIFRKRKPDGTVQDADRICRYCTGTFLPHNLESHEAECKPSFAEGSKRQRVRRYREIHPSKAVKEFSAQHSRYQVPFLSMTGKRARTKQVATSPSLTR